MEILILAGNVTMNGTLPEGGSGKGVWNLCEQIK